MAENSFPQGTWVRLTRETIDLGTTKTLASESEFEIEEFVTAGDPSKDEIAVDFYYGNANGGCNNVAVPADAVELVRTAEQQRARTLPTLVELARKVSSALIGEGGIYETEVSVGTASVEAYGRTAEGLTFGFDVRVMGAWRTDD